MMGKFKFRLCSLLLVFLLSACSGSSDKKIAEVVVPEVVNSAPVARITMETTTIVLGNEIAFNGNDSTDAEGDNLTYLWRVEKPDGEEHVLDDNTLDSIVFTPEPFGIYTIELTVNDGTLNSETVTSEVTVEPNEQSYPVAVIEGDVNNKVGRIIWLSAEGSQASDGQLLNYFWEIQDKPDGSNTTIVDDTTVNTYLTPDIAGTYEVLLTVMNNESELTATETITITAEEILINSAPVPLISEPLSSYVPNQLIRLNASDSYDHDGDLLTYQWTLELPSSSHNSTFSGDSTEFVEFSSDGIGEYQLTLIVSDGLLTSEITEIIIIENQNIVPIANAGDDQISAVGVLVELDGAESSDAESADLLYRWQLVSKPVTSDYDYVSGPDYTQRGNFHFVGDVIGVYVFSLQVFDGIDYSEMDNVQIEVVENQKPVAILADDLIVNHSGPTTVQTNESYDPEGSQLTYHWSLLSKPEGSSAEFISIENLSIRSFIIDVEGTYTIQLIVNDGMQDSLPATINYVYTAAPLYELNVTGQLVDAGGLPLSMIDVGGILQPKVKSTENGDFDVTLKSAQRNAALSVLTFKGDNIISTVLKLGETEAQSLDLGSVTLPVLQPQQVSLTACPSYSGSDKVTLYFLLTTEGYENMHFYVPVEAEFNIGEDPIEVNLPATGVILMRVATTVTDRIYVETGDAFFTNQYKPADVQGEPLSITICN